MPDLLGVPRRLREIGRIRLGDSTPVKTRGGKEGKRPRKLDTFRLTTTDRVAIEVCAREYGGTIESWDAPAGRQFDLHSEADEIDIYLPPHEVALSQYFELWSGGECVRRCDGQIEILNDSPCICAAEDGERQCKPTSRLSVILAKVPGIGVWRLETHGYKAAAELPGTIALLDLLGVNGLYVPARLRTEARSQIVKGKTHRFRVPVIDLDVTPQDLVAPRAGELPAGENGGLEEGAAAAPALGGGGDALAAAVDRANTETLPPLADETTPDPVPPPDDDDEEGPGPPKRSATPPKRRTRSAVPPAGDADTPDDGQSKVLQRVAMTCTDAGLDDDGRHSLCGAITEGAKWSSKALTIEEQQAAIRAAQRIKAEDWRLIPAIDDVPPYLVEASTGWRIEPISGAVDLLDARSDLKERLEALPDEVGEQAIKAWKAAKLGKLADLPYDRLYEADRLVKQLEPF